MGSATHQLEDADKGGLAAEKDLTGGESARIGRDTRRGVSANRPAAAALMAARRFPLKQGLLALNTPRIAR
jgi:hypothetical protein